jgi:hypothetical protein
MTEAIAKLMPTKSDADAADELKVLARPMLEQLCALQGRARSMGMRLEFAIGVDQYGRDVVSALNVVKVM